MFLFSVERKYEHLKKVGLYRILIWSDIRPIILPDTGYPVKNKFNLNVKKKQYLAFYLYFFLSLHSPSSILSIFSIC